MTDAGRHLDAGRSLSCARSKGQHGGFSLRQKHALSAVEPAASAAQSKNQQLRAFNFEIIG
jgi:hypothetical protein